MVNYRALAGLTALVGGLVLVPAAAAYADPTTYTVGNPARCAGVDFTTITAAVTAAAPGDTIQVCAGTFGESVDINKPNLTLLGVRAGEDAVGRTGPASVVSNANGVFTIEGNADGTTIDGFTIQGASVNNAVGIADFQGSSGLTLVNNIVKLNSEGINMQNPDASQPALIAHNAFLNNNAGGDPGNNGNTGTGVFISNGPAHNTTITDNRFTQDSQTAINFAGDSSRPSTGLVVTDNVSSNDSTFVVAANSTGALVEDNHVTTSQNVPGGGHGSGILDFGNNTALQIRHNTMTATGPTGSTGISLNVIAGPSAYTTVTGNSVSGWANDVRVATGNTSGYISDNHLNNAQANGILVLTGTSGIQVTHNTVHGAAGNACEDDSTGNGTAGTANLWRRNVADSASVPAAICSNPA
jgi:hypothetical protein